VLDHLAKPAIKLQEIESWAAGVRRLAAFPNVFCKLSGLITEADWQRWKPEDIAPYLNIAFETFGASRLMIGSDWPVCLVAGSYSRTIDVVKNYLQGYPAETRDAVLGENAGRFWRLKA